MNYKTVTEAIANIDDKLMGQTVYKEAISKIIRQFENGIRRTATLELNNYLKLKFTNNEIAIDLLIKKVEYIKGRTRYYMMAQLKKPCRQNRDSAIHYLAQEELLNELITKFTEK